MEATPSDAGRSAMQVHRLPETTWRSVVRGVVSVGGRIPLRRGAVAQTVHQAFVDHAIPNSATIAEAATVAASLARELYELRPLRLLWGRCNADVSAKAAGELLRCVGWSPRPDFDSLVAGVLRENASVATVARTMTAYARPPGEMARRDVEVYVSVPYSGISPKERRPLQDVCRVIEHELEKLGPGVSLNFFTRTPGLGEWSPDENLTLVRSGLHRAVMHVVIGHGGGSTGVGMELRASLSRRRPVLWLVPPGGIVPRSVMAAAVEGDIVIEPYTDEKSVRDILARQVNRWGPELHRVREESARIPVEVHSLQRELADRIEEPKSIQGLSEARISTARAALLVVDPFVLYHETSLGELNAITGALGLSLMQFLGANGQNPAVTSPWAHPRRRVA